MIFPLSITAKYNSWRLLATWFSRRHYCPLTKNWPLKSLSSLEETQIAIARDVRFGSGADISRSGFYVRCWGVKRKKSGGGRNRSMRHIALKGRQSSNPDFSISMNCTMMRRSPGPPTVRPARGKKYPLTAWPAVHATAGRAANPGWRVAAVATLPRLLFVLSGTLTVSSRVRRPLTPAAPPPLFLRRSAPAS